MAEKYKIFSIIDIDQSPRDLYEVFYDKEQEDAGPGNYFVVEKNSVIVSSGDSFNFNQADDREQLRFRIVDYNVTFDTATEKTSFEIRSPFPYATRNREVFEDTSGEDDIDDMVLSLSQTPATDGLTNDGKITPSATGTNSPFTFAIAIGDTFYTAAEVAAQISGGTNPFGNRYPGIYSPIAKDSKGFTRTAQIEVLSQEIAGIITYGALYEYEFSDDANQNYKVEIQERNFSDPVTPLTFAADSPFILTLESESKEIEDLQILAKSCAFNLMVTVDGFFSALIGSDEEKYKIVFYKDNGGYEKQWEGFVIPQVASEDYFHTPYGMRLVASDRLGELSAFDWSSEATLSQINILKICLDATKIVQGYRIALEIWDAGHTSGANTTPLHQTYINTICYKGETYEDIVKHILKPYNAMVQSWEGHWYIERIQEKTDTIVNFKQFDSDLVYQSSSSYTSRVSFGTTQGTSRVRWKELQNQTFSKQYRDIKLFLELIQRESGISNGFEKFVDEWTEHFPGNLGFLAVGFIPRLNQVVINTPRGNSNVFIKKSGEMEHSILDEIELKVNIRVATRNDADILDGDALRAPYIPFKWKFSLGSKWLTSGGQWSDTEVTNQFFITEVNNQVTLRIRAPLFGSGGSSSTYTVFLYGASVFEADISAASQALMIGTFEAVTTTSLTGGERLVGRVNDGSDDIEMYYYELRRDSGTDASDINSIKPSDHATSLKRWFLASQWDYDHTKYTSTFSGLFTLTTLSEFDLDFFPNAEEAPEVQELLVNASKSNKRDLEIPLFHHDLTGNISSDQYLYTNFLQLSDGTQTTQWTDSLATKQIQRHFMDLMQKLYRKARVVINGDMHSNADITPLSVLYNADDDGRISLMTGVSLDYKLREHDGEVVEIASDSSPVVNDFLVNDFLAADYN